MLRWGGEPVSRPQGRKRGWPPLLHLSASELPMPSPGNYSSEARRSTCWTWVRGPVSHPVFGRFLTRPQSPVFSQFRDHADTSGLPWGSALADHSQPPCHLLQAVFLDHPIAHGSNSFDSLLFACLLCWNVNLLNAHSLALPTYVCWLHVLCQQAEDILLFVE